MPGSAVIRKGLIAGLLLGSFMLSACNGDTTSSAATGSTGTTPATSPVNPVQTLALSGTPTGAVTVGQAYSFVPVLASTASSVAFSIQNKPVWATFDASTGTLTGTPGLAHVGSYNNIVISALGGTANASLAAFSITVAQVGASSGSATLSWTVPAQNTDGSAVANLAGYRIYYGSTSGAMTNSINVTNPGLTAYTVADLSAGTHYFGMTAYTTGGVESDLSNIGSKTVM